MTRSDHSKLDQASEWAMRVDDPAFEDWPQLERWLAKDPEHPVVFDAACRGVDAAARSVMDLDRRPRLHVIDKASDIVTTPGIRTVPRRREWVAAGVAAALALVVGYDVVADRSTTGTSGELFVSRPGEVRTISLGPDGKATLNGDSAVRIDLDASEAELVAGQAVFDIRHDPSRTFTVRVGAARIVDLGTRFDVDRGADGYAVAVAEGSVDVSASGRTVRVGQGQRTQAAYGEAPRIPVPVAPGAVGTWQDGRLVYEGASIDKVATDVARLTGIRISASSDVAAKPFSGIVDTRGGTSLVIERVEDILDLDAVASGDGWVLNARRNRGDED